MCIAGVAIYSCDAVLPPFFQGCSMHHDNRPEQDLCEKRGWSTHVFFTAVKCTGNPRSWICSVCLHLKELVALKFQSVFQLSLAGWLVDACSYLSSFISSSLGGGARVTSVGVTARTLVESSSRLTTQCGMNLLGKSRGNMWVTFRGSPSYHHCACGFSSINHSSWDPTFMNTCNK